MPGPISNNSNGSIDLVDLQTQNNNNNGSSTRPASQSQSQQTLDKKNLVKTTETRPSAANVLRNRFRSNPPTNGGETYMIDTNAETPVGGKRTKLIETKDQTDWKTANKILGKIDGLVHHLSEAVRDVNQRELQVGEKLESHH